jgi:hypothetical protein
LGWGGWHSCPLVASSPLWCSLAVDKFSLESSLYSYTLNAWFLSEPLLGREKPCWSTATPQSPASRPSRRDNGSLGVLTHTRFEPRSPVAKSHASSRRGTWHEPQWYMYTCFVATRLGTDCLRLRAGPRQHLSRTEGVILGPGEAGGDRCCFTRNSELF